MVDSQTGRVTFELPEGSPDVDLGNVTIDSEQGKAWCGSDPALAETAATFPVDEIAWYGDSNIPSGAPATPTFGANAFEQQMIRFEEFGLDTMPTATAAGWTALPQPQNAQSGPAGAALDAFLAQPGVSPFPTLRSNVTNTNPWNGAIETYLGRSLASVEGGSPGPAEGRPTSNRDENQFWAHQYWYELPPQTFFKTSVSPARVNNGLRDSRQRHGYAVGEFGPGGLYHTVFTWSGGAPTLTGSTNGLPIALHPLMPVQDPNSVWTFDGTLPPRLLQGRYGVPVLMRNYNTLPIDETANVPAALDPAMVSNGFGRHTISTHDHNGHNAGEADGGPVAFFFPGQFYDYHWPLNLAGFSNNDNAAGAINYDASDPRAATPCEAGETISVLVNGVPTPRACNDPDGDGHGTVMIPGDWRETMSTHWFHDHMFDHTSENVYKGNATMYDYYSALDRGNEAVNDGVNLRLPSGTALSWGNRDYDVHLLVADKATDQNGQLWFNTLEREGFLGDVMTVNWLYKPYFDVRARRYRFRFLNGGVARVLKHALVQEVNGTGGELPGPTGSGKSYKRVPFHMIANDGNIMEHAVPFDGVRDLMHDGKPDVWKGQLPAEVVAERYDIIVDFAKHGIQPGDKLYFVNTMEHADGRGSKRTVPLADILSEAYHPVIQDNKWINGDPCVGKYLELRVQAYSGTDLSLDPVDYEPGKLSMIPLPLDRVNKCTTLPDGSCASNGNLLTARHRTHEFVRSNGGHETPWQIKVNGGEANPADGHRISAIFNGDPEVITITGGRGWTHPVHIHFEEGMILTRGGKLPPDWELYGRKDMYRIGPEDESKEIEAVYRARDILGNYPLHCHNTTHEDYAMLMRFDNQPLGFLLADMPLPTFDGVFFEPSFAVENGTAETGDGIGPKKGVPTEP
jgi:FtsP/CotA-like multicopper oxidase with cupredoxin domain